MSCEFAVCISPQHAYPGHVECPARVEAVAERLRGLGGEVVEVKTGGRLATREEVRVRSRRLCHNCRLD